MEAGKAAGMTTIAVGYGYITPGEDPNDWGADMYAADTMALVDILRTALRTESND